MKIGVNSNSRIVSNHVYLDRMSEPILAKYDSGLYIGKSKIYKLPVILDLDSLVNRNIAVVGMSGSGKSYFLKSFIIKSHFHRSSKVLIIDWNNEYKEIVKYLRGRILKLGSDFGINIFDLYSIKSTRSIKSICDIISYSIGLDRDESYAIYNELLSIHDEYDYGVFNLKSLVKLLSCSDNEHSEKISKKLLQLDGNPMFADSTHFNVDMMLNDIISIDFSGLKDDFQRNETSKLMFRIIVELMHKTQMSITVGTEQIVVLDEAWRLLKNSDDVGTLFREGRKYGFCIAVATQMVTDIDNEVLSNSACVFVFRLQNDKDYNVLIDCGIIDNDDRSKINNLPIGSCMISMALSNGNGEISKFFIDSIDGEKTHEFTIRGDKMQHIVSHKLFSEATKGLLISEEAKGKISDFVLRNDSEVEDIQLVRFMADLGIERSEIICYMRRLGLKDIEIVKAYENVVAASLR